MNIDYSNQKSFALLEDKQYHLDELGRVVIDDPEVLQMIQGALGSSGGGFSEPLWNGACGNSRC